MIVGLFVVVLPVVSFMPGGPPSRTSIIEESSSG